MAPQGIERLAEAEVVAAFRQTGDPRYFAELYRRERRSVMALCLRYVRDPALAEDVCQDAFVRAWQRWDGFMGNRFGAWVRAIAVRTSLDRLRREAIRRAPCDEAPPAPPVPLQEAVSREELALARDIVAALEPSQRAVFLLRHLDGLSYQEIASVTGLDSEAVRSRLQNARRNFRLAWEGGVASPVRRDHG